MPSETLSRRIAQTTSGDETGQVEMHLVVETTYANFTPPKILK